jgi:hypothetical protein
MVALTEETVEFQSLRTRSFRNRSLMFAEGGVVSGIWSV